MMPTPNFPVGFRFRPSPVEVVERYLRPRVVEGILAPSYLIQESDVYQHNPWDLFQMHHHHHPGAFKYSDDHMYFFSPRHHAGGSSSARRACRIAGSGFWAGQGKDDLIKKHGRVIGHKTQLTFKKLLEGKKQTIKTDWLMHEFRLGDGGKFDDLVLCKIYEKKSAACRQQQEDDHGMMLEPHTTPIMSVLEDNDHDHQKEDIPMPRPVLLGISSSSSSSMPADDDQPLPTAQSDDDQEVLCAFDFDEAMLIFTQEDIDSFLEATADISSLPWDKQFEPNSYTTLTT